MNFVRSHLLGLKNGKSWVLTFEVSFVALNSVFLVPHPFPFSAFPESSCPLRPSSGPYCPAHHLRCPPASQLHPKVFLLCSRFPYRLLGPVLFCLTCLAPFIDFLYWLWTDFQILGPNFLLWQLTSVESSDPILILLFSCHLLRGLWCGSHKLMPQYTW